MDTVTEDFSFPTISDTYGGCVIDSPLLWNLSSPKGSSNSYQVPIEGRNKRGEKDSFEAKVVSNGHRKSFSCDQNGKKIIGVDDEEVPMDLLWEVFNEDLSSTKGLVATSSSREMVEFKCVTTTALTVAKARGALLQTKNRPSVVVIVKVLKKLFSINNFHGKPRKRPF